MKSLWNGFEIEYYQKDLKKQGKTFTALLAGMGQTTFCMMGGAVLPEGLGF